MALFHFSKMGRRRKPACVIGLNSMGVEASRKIYGKKKGNPRIDLFRFGDFFVVIC